MNWFKSFWKKMTASGPDVPGMTETQVKVELANNFTPRAQQVFALARREADRLHHSFLGTEHVLLGLIALGQGVAANILQKLGVDLLTVRSEIEHMVGTGSYRQNIGNIPYTPRVKKVLDLARREAKNLNHTYIGTEHILLGLLREGDSVAARVLRHLNVDLEQTRLEIVKELDPFYDSPGGLPPKAASTPPKPSPSHPQGEPVDTSKRYDVHCTDWSQGVTVYKNVRFKGVKHLFQRSAYDVLSGYVELEQENGQSVFVSRGSIIRFSEPGT